MSRIEYDKDGLSVYLHEGDYEYEDLEAILKGMDEIREEIGDKKKWAIMDKFPEEYEPVFCPYLCTKIIGYKNEWGDKVTFDELCECDRYGR